MLQESPRILALRHSVVALGRGARRGSGLVVGQDRVVTLRHSLVADRVETFLGDGRGREGRVAGVDRGVGGAVLALGNPGTGLRITEGRVSAEPLTIRSRHGRPIEVIEHTAPMPRGA